MKNLRSGLLVVVTTAVALLASLLVPGLAPMADAQEEFSCVVVDDVLSWTDQAASSYQIRQTIDGTETFLTSVSGVTMLALPGKADSYTVRYRDGLTPIDTTCAGNPAPPFTCTVGDGVVTWTNQGVDNYNVRQLVGDTASFLGSTSFRVFPVDGFADFYVIRIRVNGEIEETSCAGNVRPEFTCSVTDNVLSWTDQGLDRYQVRQVIGDAETFLTTVDGALSLDLPGRADGYVVRARISATELLEASCEGNPAPAFTCAYADGVVTWSNQFVDSYSVRQVIDGTESFLGTATFRVFPVSGLADTYVIRYRLNGEIVEASCPGIERPAFTCSVVDGVLTWTDQSADNYVVRQSIEGTETFLGSTTFRAFPVSGTADEYIVRINADGVNIEARCAGEPLAEFTCTVVDDILTWTDQMQDRYQIREVNAGVEGFLTTVEGATEFVLPSPIADEYVVRFRLDGVANDARCFPEVP